METPGSPQYVATSVLVRPAVVPAYRATTRLAFAARRCRAGTTIADSGKLRIYKEAFQTKAILFETESCLLHVTDLHRYGL